MASNSREIGREKKRNGRKRGVGDGVLFVLLLEDVE